MMPRPPARDTAEASWVRAIQPIGACTIGYLAPVWARTRFMAIHCCESERAENAGRGYVTYSVFKPSAYRSARTKPVKIKTRPNKARHAPRHNHASAAALR